MHDILQQILYFFGNGLCHQLPLRSFEAGGVFFSVCARDTGIYMGIVLTLAVLVIRYSRVAAKPAAMPPVWAIIVAALLVAPMALDGVASYLGIYETTNLARFATGYLCGAGVGILASGGLFGLWQNATHSASAVGKPVSLLTLLVISFALGTAFYALYPFLGVVTPLVAFACQWLAFTFVTVLIVSTTSLWTAGKHTTQHFEEASVPVQQTPTPIPTSFLATKTTDYAGYADTSNSARRSTGKHIAIISACFVLAGVEMALFSLIADALGLLLPW